MFKRFYGFIISKLGQLKTQKIDIKKLPHERYKDIFFGYIFINLYFDEIIKSDYINYTEKSLFELSNFLKDLMVKLKLPVPEYSGFKKMDNPYLPEDYKKSLEEIRNPLPDKLIKKTEKKDNDKEKI